MYLPKHHEETDLRVLQALVGAHPLGAWVTLGPDGLIANHLPFLLEPSMGANGTLTAHVARANPVWQHFSTTVPSVVLFQGAECYITPSWYPGKQEHGKVVPTWNYAVVHVHGWPRVIEDAAWLRRHVHRLTDVHEAAQPVPWKVDDAPPGFVDRLLEGIVGIEIPIDRIVGKWKTSQNRVEAERRGVVAGLERQGDERSRAMAACVRRSMGAKE